MSDRRQLEGQRVLLIAPKFFGYDDEVQAEFERRGAQVTRLLDRPFTTPSGTAITKLAPEAVALAAERLYRRQLSDVEDFQIVFVVNGQTLSTSFLRWLRAAQPQANFILYIWDSFKNRRSIIPNLPIYDGVMGFDADDAKDFGFSHRPLFFVPAFDRVSEGPLDFDISFAGTAHSDRAPLVKRIDAALTPAIMRYWFLFLQAPWVYWYYRLRNPAFSSLRQQDFSFKPKSRQETAEIFHRSRTILDIEHPSQRGLTIRTFEALGACKKLVTTNGNIRNYDFYNPDNILIINRHTEPVIPQDFLKLPYVPVPAHLRSRYSIAGWLDEILLNSGVDQPCRATSFSKSDPLR